MPKPQTVAALALVNIDGRIVTIDTTGTRAAPGSKIEFWEVYWGDGNKNDDPGKPLINLDHEYEESNFEEEYSITLIVKDNKNRVASAMLIVKVGPVIIQAPVITSLSPDNGEVGSNLGIIGTNFGIQQGNNVITVNGVQANVISWTDNFIVVIVPNTTTGPVVVTVNGIPSNGIIFNVQVITPPLIEIINANQLPDGEVGLQTQIQFLASGGSPPYIFTGNNLPSGMSLSPSGLYSGIPTVEGTFIFNIEVTDTATGYGSEDFTQIINQPVVGPPLEISTASVPNGIVGVFYSQQLEGIGGTPPYSWALSSGSLPPGLSLINNTIQGTPTTNGSSSFQIRLRDSVGTEVFRTYQIVVTGALLTITSSSPLPTAQLNNPYSFTFTASGGVPPYTFSKFSGSFPIGLNLVGATLSGTPTLLQTSNFTIRVIDSNGDHFDKLFDIVVSQVSADSYFDNLSALSECLYAYSLRNQAQLNSLVPSGNATSFSYIYPADSYSDKQDAAKLVFPTDRASLAPGQQINVDIHLTSGRFIIIWNFFWGPEWRKVTDGGYYDFAFDSAYTHKEFQSRFAPDGKGEGSITFEVQTQYRYGDVNHIGAIGTRIYNPLAPGQTDNRGYPYGAGVSPTARSNYRIPHSKWIRYIKEIRLNVLGSDPDFDAWETLTGVTLDPSTLYHMFSLWVIEEGGLPVRWLYNLPHPRYKQTDPSIISNGICLWYTEMNTSSDVGCLINNPISYARDIVVLKDYILPPVPENDTTIFQAPNY